MDQKLLYLINQEWQSPVLDWVMVALSALAYWMPLFIVTGVAVAIWGGFRGRAYLIVLGLTIAVGDGLIARYGKRITDEPRPHQLVYGLTVRSPQRISPEFLAAFKMPRTKPSQPKPFYQPGRSFPSAHTINLFSVATVTFVFFGRRWLWLYLPAALVSYSRIYVGVHWPSDLPPSVLIGILCGFGIPYLLHLLWRRFAPRQAPFLLT